MSNSRKSAAGAISIASYTAVQLIANILSVKIVLLPIIGLSMDGGTLIYPFTFTLRDFIHKSLGKKTSRTVVVSAAALNALMAGLFWLVGRMPADPAWMLGREYNAILLPVFRIVAASIIAQVISELLDTEIFSRVYKLFSDILGSLASNFIALIFDSLIFTVVAFWGALPVSSLAEIMLANIMIKAIISVISSPLIRIIPRQVGFNDI